MYLARARDARTRPRSTHLAQDVVSLAKEVIPAVSARIGVSPFEETAEELRLQLVELCATILKRMPAEAVADFVSDLALMFARVVTDTFPDVKRACCAPIEIIAAAAPSEVSAFSFGSVNPFSQRD